MQVTPQLLHNALRFGLVSPQPEKPLRAGMAVDNPSELCEALSASPNVSPWTCRPLAGGCFRGEAGHAGHETGVGIGQAQDRKSHVLTLSYVLKRKKCLILIFAMATASR